MRNILSPKDSYFKGVPQEVEAAEGALTQIFFLIPTFSIDSFFFQMFFINVLSPKMAFVCQITGLKLLAARTCWKKSSRAVGSSFPQQRAGGSWDVRLCWKRWALLKCNKTLEIMVLFISIDIFITKTDVDRYFNRFALVISSGKAWEDSRGADGRSRISGVTERFQPQKNCCWASNTMFFFLLLVSLMRVTLSTIGFVLSVSVEICELKDWGFLSDLVGRFEERLSWFADAGSV